MNRVAIVAAKRSPIGSFGGVFKNVSAVELGVQVLRNILNETLTDVDSIDEVIIGNVVSSGLGQNIARQISVNAGIPDRIPAWTVNKVCGSGMKAVTLAAQSIANGEAEIIAAGGVENMSRIPYYLPDCRWGAKMGNKEAVDGIICDGLTDVFNNYHMGVTAENLADKYNITREEMDEFAVQSQEKAVQSVSEGRFREEIVSVRIPQRKGDDLLIDTDEYPRKDTTLESLAKLKPAFRKEGRVTAGNSSGINDGAAILLLMSEKKAKSLSLKPLAYLTGYASAGVDPSIMGIGPVFAIKKLLHKSGQNIDNIGLFELNEAFAAQSIAVLRGLEEENIGSLSAGKVNVNGGAIALGHPIGASGARIIVTLINAMRNRDIDTGLASLCIGGGMGMASLLSLTTKLR